MYRVPMNTTTHGSSTSTRSARSRRLPDLDQHRRVSIAQKRRFSSVERSSRQRQQRSGSVRACSRLGLSTGASYPARRGRPTRDDSTGVRQRWFMASAARLIQVSMPFLRITIVILATDAWTREGQDAKRFDALSKSVEKPTHEHLA